MSRLVRCLFALAVRIMPRARHEWLRAMRAEADYLPGFGAVRWACGCMHAALRARFSMNTGDFRVSRWVMIVETLGCFGVLTLAWFEITFGASGLLRQDWGVVRQAYLSYPGGPFILGMLLLGCVVGLVGPIGLFLGARYVIQGRGLASRALASGLIAAPLVFVVASLAGFYVGPADWQGNTAIAILCVLLPVAGIAHLAWLARVGGRAPPRDLAATPAA